MDVFPALMATLSSVVNHVGTTRKAIYTRHYEMVMMLADPVTQGRSLDHTRATGAILVCLVSVLLSLKFSLRFTEFWKIILGSILFTDYLTLNVIKLLTL